MEADIETSSPDYRKRFAGTIGAYLLSVQSNHIQNGLAGMLPGETLLDVGGGHGQVLEAVTPLKLQTTVLSSAPECKTLLAGIPHTFTVGSLETLPFQDSSFTAVSCIRYLTHSDHWQRTLDEMCRVAKRFVLIEYPPIISFNATYPLLFKLKKKLEGDTRTFKLFKHAELISIAEKNGFAVKKRAGQFFWPIVLHRKIKSPLLAKLLELLPKITGLTNLFGSPTFLLFERKNS